MTYTLRRVRADEVDAYRELVLAAYAPTLGMDIHFRAASASRDDVAAHLARNVAFALTNEIDAIVSTISVRFPWGPNPGPYGLPHVGWLATDPGQSRGGLGAEVMRRVERDVLAERLHAPAVSLGTARNHPWLHEFYRRSGYTETGGADLGLGHFTVYYVKPLDPEGFAAWRAQHPDLLKGTLA